jgi:nucleotide-binding universal stress UspA family protein
MPGVNVKRSIGAAIDQGKQEYSMSISALMVHVDVEHDSEQRVELAIGLADRFQAALIGVAGCALWPAFTAGEVGLAKSNQYDFQKMMARFEQRGETFRAKGHCLKQVEWRSALESPRELLLREARAADLLIIGRGRGGIDDDPGVILLRAGRPVLLVPDTTRILPRDDHAAKRQAEQEKADLIVAGGYGHSRLGEWIFGGVTRELLAGSPVCCMLSH